MHDYLVIRSLATTAGKNGPASPPLRRTSLTNVEATDVYWGKQVRKIVSISLFRLRFISAIAFSYSKSFTYRIPRMMNLAPVLSQAFIVKPSYTIASTRGLFL